MHVGDVDAIAKSAPEDLFAILTRFEFRAIQKYHGVPSAERRIVENAVVLQ